MDNFDEKLNKILGDPEALARVAELARGFGGGQRETPPEAPSAPSGFRTEAPPDSHGNIDPGILGALGNLDPKTLTGIAGLLGDLTSKDDRRTQLLTALRPYVRQGRQEKMDRAVQLVQLSKVAKRALGMFGRASNV
jgi:hypothetical protein